MSSALEGGNWLRTGGGVVATGGFFAAHPARSKQDTSQKFLMPSVFARMRLLVDGDLGYRSDEKIPCEAGADINLIKALQPFDRETQSRSTTLPRERHMSPRKLCLFMLAATLAGFATAEKLNVQIQEYEVPTPKSRPHDPAVAPDGSLWCTGQGANKLGRLDPKTGNFREYALKTANSGPHGLVADKDGNIWFTAISGGYVGRLDTNSGRIAEYRPADGTTIDPHTPIFDRDGILWFTNEETNYLGRLDPKTGKISLIKVPTPHAVPYGIVILPNNMPFFCEFGSNKLASVEPGTMKIREYVLPAAGARPRRIALAADGTVYYTDYARGYLGHFDPAEGKLLKEWMSPGGTGSEPYGIAITNDGEVWYSESGVKPNTLVKFDAKSESFSANSIPSGGGVVRNMVATPDRRLYLACSGVNKVAVVDLNK